MKRLIALFVLIIAAYGCAGKQTPQPLPTPVAQAGSTRHPEAANVVATIGAAGESIERGGAKPGDDKAKMIRKGAEALKLLTGEGKVLEMKPEAIKPEADNIQATQTRETAEIEKQRKYLQTLLDTITTLNKRVDELTDDSVRNAWIALGVSAAAALAAVFILSNYFGSNVGGLAFIAWVLLFTGLSIGLMYEQHPTASYVGGGVVVVCVILIMILGGRLSKALVEWQVFGAKRVAKTQELRKQLDPESRSKVDAILTSLNGNDPKDAQQVQAVKEKLALPSVTDATKES